MADFKKLVVWQKAFDFSVKIYQKTISCPKNMDFRFRDQLRSSAVSIPSNIAEGYHRRSELDKARFFEYARASCAEFETQLLIAIELSFFEPNAADDVLKEVRQVSAGLLRMIHSMRK